MRDFSAITVVSVTGLQAAAAGVVPAIVHGLHCLPGARGLLICPEPPANLPKEVAHVAIRPFGYFEYSLFVLYALGQFIETEYALIVQEDGWILDARNWREEFLHYDYLGAPIHLARVSEAGASRYYRGFEWTVHLGKPEVRIENIYNGGFSLRSKRLLDAPRALGMEFVVPVPDLSKQTPYAMRWPDDVVLEDVWLCLMARPRLEAAGLRFPPLALARDFAIEHVGPGFHDDASLQRLFGHHSRLRKLGGIDPLSLRCGYAESVLPQIFGEAAVLSLFQAQGYQLRWPE